jgi:hypothetical protein
MDVLLPYWAPSAKWRGERRARSSVDVPPSRPATSVSSLRAVSSTSASDSCSVIGVGVLEVIRASSAPTSASIARAISSQPACETGTVAALSFI